MMRTVLWIAAACVAVLAALAVSRTLHLGDSEPAPAPPAPPPKAAPPPPAAAVKPPPAPPKPAPVLTPEQQQIEDDAAATGMTTMEPAGEPPR